MLQAVATLMLWILLLVIVIDDGVCAIVLDSGSVFCYELYRKKSG
jgi:hypothetical protein